MYICDAHTDFSVPGLTSVHCFLSLLLACLCLLHVSPVFAYSLVTFDLFCCVCVCAACLCVSVFVCVCVSMCVSVFVCCRSETRQSVRIYVLDVVFDMVNAWCFMYPVSEVDALLLLLLLLLLCCGHCCQCFCVAAASPGVAAVAASVSALLLLLLLLLLFSEVWSYNHLGENKGLIN